MKKEETRPVQMRLSTKKLLDELCEKTYISRVDIMDLALKEYSKKVGG